MAERMDHDKMRRASEMPVSGPAATDSLAASGGLELPGRAAEGPTRDEQRDRAAAQENVPPTAASIDRLAGGRRGESEQVLEDASKDVPEASSDAPARARGEDPGDVSPARLEPIPGEHDHTTAMTSQPGIVGTTGYGVDVPSTGDSTVNDELSSDARWEGGGRLGRRDRK
jgi:hypothetical protein